VEFVYAYRFGKSNSTIIEDLLDLASEGKQEAVNACVTMLEDLHKRGLESRFVKKLAGINLWELKTRSRGGQKGGARVYFFVTSNEEALVINAEVKDGDAPSKHKLKEALAIIRDYERDSDEKENS
jgi:hypothetical protein